MIACAIRIKYIFIFFWIMYALQYQNVERKKMCAFFRSNGQPFFFSSFFLPFIWRSKNVLSVSFSFHFRYNIEKWKIDLHDNNNLNRATETNERRKKWNKSLHCLHFLASGISYEWIVSIFIPQGSAQMIANECL